MAISGRIVSRRTPYVPISFRIWFTGTWLKEPVVLLNVSPRVGDDRTRNKLGYWPRPTCDWSLNPSWRRVFWERHNFQPICDYAHEFHTPFVNALQQVVPIPKCTIPRIDVAIIRTREVNSSIRVVLHSPYMASLGTLHIIAHIRQRRSIYRWKPEHIDAQVLQIIQFCVNSVQITYPVSVWVEKRDRIDLINDGLFPPCLWEGHGYPRGRFSSWGRQKRKRWAYRILGSRNNDSERCDRLVL